MYTDEPTQTLSLLPSMAAENHRAPAEFAYLSYHLLLIEGVSIVSFALVCPTSTFAAVTAIPVQIMAIVLARRARPVASGHVAVAGLMMFCVTTAVTSGGLASPALAGLVAVPVLAALLLDGRATVAWGTLAFAVALGMALPVVQASLVHPAPTGLSLHGMRLFVLGTVGLVLGRAVHRLIEDARQTYGELEVSHQQARHAIEAAQMHSQAKSSFLASMSHELRTPMNGVVGITGLLLRSDLNKEQREHVHTIQSSGQALLAIINDVLDFSRVEAGMITVETVPCDLRTLVREVSSLLDVGARRKGVGLHLEVSDTVPPGVLTDPGRLRQILLNVAGNAVKFTTEGAVTIMVQADDVDDTAANISFIVEDTGCGIPAHALPTLFKRYVRARTSKTRKHAGTGLGLAISKALIDLLGGTVNVESTEGQGTRFTIQITMPVCGPVHAPKPAAIQSAVFHARVLLAEDNVINQRVAQAMLERVGCNVDIVDDGVKAVAAARATAYDIVLMDCEMPEMNGFDATEAIRESGSEVPIVALTAHVMDDVRKQAKAAGMDEFITKPYTIDQVGHLLAKYCKHTMVSPTPQGAQRGQRDYATER